MKLAAAGISIVCVVIPLATSTMSAQDTLTVRFTVAPQAIVQLARPWGVAADASGQVFIADTDNHVVRKLTPDGLISIVAGTGLPGFDPDGGAATSTRLRAPAGLALDAAGNLLIADSGNHCVRKLTPAGVITIVAGTGAPGYRGDDGPATSAALSRPLGVAVTTTGDVIIADTENHRVRVVTADGRIHTIAGSTAGFSGDGGPAASARLRSPVGIAIDGAGNILITEFDNHRVRRVAPSGIITTVAGTGTFGFSGDGGAATSAQLSQPASVAIDRAGNLLVADLANNRIRSIARDGGIRTVAGNGQRGGSGDAGPASVARLDQPSAIAVDPAGNVFIAEAYGGRVRKISSDGMITIVAGLSPPQFAGDGGPAVLARIARPSGLAADASGNLFVADAANYRVRKVDPSGVISTVAGTGVSGFSGDGGPATAATLGSPTALAVDAAGNLLVAFSGSSRVRRVSRDGLINTIAGSERGGHSGDGGVATSARIGSPSALAVDPAGNLFIGVTGPSNYRVRKVDARGLISTAVGAGGFGASGDKGPAAKAKLYGARALVVDREGDLLIVDGARIRRVTPAGVITTILGRAAPARSCGPGAPSQGPTSSMSLMCPTAIVVDRVGNLLVADSALHAVLKVAPDGLVTTVAGNGMRGLSGDDGPAVRAQLDAPAALAMDTAGNLYIADTGNHRVRKVAATGVITTVVGR